MRYFFPTHIDGGNRGCEAITKATAMILGQSKDNLIALSNNVELDTRLGLNQYVSLVREGKQPLGLRLKNKLIRTLHLPFDIKWEDPYSLFLSKMNSRDMVLSTGGDLLCYNNSMVSRSNNFAVSLGCKTVLWGCSMGPENLTKEKEDTLRKFSLVYARESLSYDFFNSIGLKNVCLLPDPAFILKPEICQLPSVFIHSRVIGINLSNFTLGGYTLDTPFGQEVVCLIEYILNETNYSILLIPHVTWESAKTYQDDRKISCLISERFNNYRISILDIDNLNYCQIRYVISKCTLFIGSRTHAVISAYSTCVPSIALSYSIKARGIAKDLGMPMKLVVDSKSVKTGCLLDSFLYLLAHEQEIRQKLFSIIPDYSQKPYQVKESLRKVVLC